MSEDLPSSRDSGWFARLRHRLGFKEKLRGRDELEDVLEDAHARSVIDADVRAMLEGVLEVSEEQVRSVMVPRSQMKVLERDAPPDEIVGQVIESGHSRFPVIGEDRDEVVGILLAKDLLRFLAEPDHGEFLIREFLRPAVFIPESKRLSVLLNEFKSNRNHMAVVVDEYGGVSGLVTIEDVLEEIVGEIEDEHDIEEAEDIVQQPDGHYAVNALTRIEDVNEYFGTEYSDEDYDTIGGLVVHAFGRLPRRGEQVTIGPLEFKVTRADRRRVHMLDAARTAESEEPPRTVAAS